MEKKNLSKKIKFQHEFLRSLVAAKVMPYLHMQKGMQMETFMFDGWRQGNIFLY